MAFTRTPAGLAEKWRFHNVPTVWVEGPTDIYFYEPMLDSLWYRLEPFHGAENAVALVKALRDHDYPYVVILDGDYSMLNPVRSPHRRIVRLPRYSFENLLWEPEAVNQACLRHARCGDQKDLVIGEMVRVSEHLAATLGDVLILDVAARRLPSPPKVLPEHIEPLLRNERGPDIDATKVSRLAAQVNGTIEVKAVQAATRDVRAFLARRPFMYLLKGHMVLGVLRRIFLNAATRESGSKMQITNDALTQLLAEMIWRRVVSDDHRKIKYKVRRTVRGLRARYPVPSAP